MRNPGRHLLAFFLLLSGFTLTPAVYAVESIQLLGLFPGKAVIMIDGNRHVISKGQSIEGVTFIDSYDDEALLDINGTQSRYKMGAGISLDFHKPVTKSKTLYANERGMFFTYGSINGRALEFIVDTGATTVAMSSIQAKQLAIPFRLEGRKTHANTASGVAKAWLVKLDKVKVGEIMQRNVTALVIEGAYPRKALLGMSFLNRIKVEKDGNTMVLESR